MTRKGRKKRGGHMAIRRSTPRGGGAMRTGGAEIIMGLEGGREFTCPNCPGRTGHDCLCGNPKITKGATNPSLNSESHQWRQGGGKTCCGEKSRTGCGEKTGDRERERREKMGKVKSFGEGRGTMLGPGNKGPTSSVQLEAAGTSQKSSSVSNEQTQSGRKKCHLTNERVNKTPEKLSQWGGVVGTQGL